MDPPPDKVDRDVTTPFLLKLYYRTGAFHRPEEFSSPQDLPPYIALHTWPSATLTELTQQLAAAAPHLLPTPAIGTRLAFRLAYRGGPPPPPGAAASAAAAAAAAAAAHGAPPQPASGRLATQDLGSVVIGGGGPGCLPLDDDGDEDGDDGIGGGGGGGRRAAGEKERSAADAEAARTLADARFVVGDFLSVAILPPSTVDGSVQPATAARAGRGYGVGQASFADEKPGRGYGDYGGFGHERGSGLGSGRMGGGGGGAGGGGDRGYGRDGGYVAPPVGEWRRGERVPDVPSPPVRRRGGGRRRW